MKKIFYVIVIFIFISSNSIPAFAITGSDTWVGDVSANLGASNWTGANNPPISGDSWTFDIAATSGPSSGATTLNNNLTALNSVAGITYTSNAPAYTINGNAITLTGNIANDASSNQTLGVGIAGAITNSGSGTGSVTISSNLGAGVSAVVQDSSTSELILSGNNSSYAGPTTLTAGILGIASNNAIGSGTINFNGGTLQYSSSNTNDYSSQFSTAVNQAYNIDTNGQAVTLVGSLSSTGGSLTKLGSGTLTLTGNNAYTGTTTLVAGILGLGSSNAIGSGTIVFDGGTLQYSSSNTTDYSSQFSTAINQAYNIDTNGQNVTLATTALSSSGGSLTKLGTGILTLSAINTYTGATNIDGGVLQISASDNLGDASSSNTISMNNGTLESTSGTYDLGTNRSITLAGAGGTIKSDSGQLTVSGGVSGTGNLTIDNASSTNGGITFSTGNINNTGTITNTSTGSGTSIISAVIGAAVTGVIQDSSTSSLILSNSGNAYSGPTTISLGTLKLGNAGAIPDLSPVSIAGGSTLDLAGYSDTIGSLSGAGTITSSAAGTEILTAGGDNTSTTFSGSIQNGSGTLGLTKEGSGVFTVSGANTFSGETTISDGTLKLGAAGSIPDTSAVSIASNGIFDLAGHSDSVGSLSGAGSVTSSVAGAETLTEGVDNSSSSFSGNLQNGSGTLGFIKAGAGTFTLNSANNYSGGTTINAGTLTVGNSNALGSGAVVNNATLAIGTTTLTLSGPYTQNTGSILDLTANSSTSFGKIITTTGSPSTLTPASTVNVSVAGYIPLNSTLDIINTQTAGISGSSPATVTSSSRFVNFSSSIVDGDLILTAEHTNTGLASLSENANAHSLGNVLDYLSNPTSDLSNVLNTLEQQSNSKISTALNTMGPVVDAGARDNTVASLNNFVGASLERLQDINASLDRIENGLGHPGTEKYITSGVSSGDEKELNGIWAKPYGSYLSQGRLQGIQGYDAWNAGTVVGLDRQITDNFTVGISGGYAYGVVESDANQATTDIMSAQSTIYAGYQNPDLNYFIDAAGSFAWNWYDGQRDINVGSIDRTADSKYDGQQFGAYLGGGYKFKLGDSLEFTPLTSLQWNHLSLPSYTEINAGSLDLNVNKQSYDILESGLGASISYETIYYWGVFTPELHAKWLYDYIDDPMSVTSSFTGGGGSFTSNGASPAKDGINAGGKLTFDLINNISLIAECETQIREGFFGVYASGTVHYKF